MAISVTEILGTDSLSGSRLVINDNFNVLASEINAMEVYFAPAAGTLTNLNNLSSEALRVGLSTILLDINASTFNRSCRLTKNCYRFEVAEPFVDKIFFYSNKQIAI